MTDLAFVVEVEKFGDNALVGERSNRQRRNELLRGLRHHHSYMAGALAQPPNEFQALVGGNPAANYKKDTLVFHSCDAFTVFTVEIAANLACW